MSVKINFTFQKLEAINQIWHAIDTLIPQTPKEKAMLSAIQDLAVKFERKQVNLKYSYNPTSSYYMTLKSYEAYFLEMFIRDLLKGMLESYTRTVVYQLADYINQKLA